MMLGLFPPDYHGGELLRIGVRECGPGCFEGCLSVRTSSGELNFVARLGWKTIAAGAVDEEAFEVDDEDDDDDQGEPPSKKEAAKKVLKKAAKLAKSPLGKAFLPAPARAVLWAAEEIRQLREDAQGGDSEAKNKLRALLKERGENPLIGQALRVQRMLG